MRALLVIALLWMVGALAAFAQHSNPWLLSWIPRHCCVTNDCCFEITERDAQSLPDDWFRIVASGQLIKRSGHSPDGRWYRCACDWSVSADKWVVHPTAFTRCLYTPFMGG